MTTPPIVSITDELIAELEQLADKATGGDWEYRLGLIRTMADSDGYVPIAVAPSAPKNWRAQRDTNMQYIASVQPSVIRALLAERAELIKTLSSLRWRLDDISDTLTARRGGDGESFYGLDEWSTPIINITRAIGVIDKAVKR